jgi:hypothetical protein
MNGKKDQAYWVVGNDPDCDILLPRFKIAFGVSFVL